MGKRYNNKDRGLDPSSVYLPHYNRKKKYWEVRFPDRWTEEGSIEYVVSEYIRDGLIYHYKADGEVNHNHEFGHHLADIIEDAKAGRNIDFSGYEHEYSEQEMQVTLKLIEKIKEDMGRG